MENFALITLVEELRPETRGMVVRRVVGHHARGFILQTRTPRMPGLKLWLDPRHPALYISGVRPPVETHTGDFLMVLRKHLAAAQLVDIFKPLSERIVELRFRTTLPARELQAVCLVVELFPNGPNVFLLDAQRRVLASLATPPPKRCIGEYSEYRYPEPRKTDLAAIGDDTEWFAEEAFAKDRHGWLIRSLAGVGPVFAAEVVHRQAASGRSLPEELGMLVEALTHPAPTAWLYTEKPFSVLLERNDIETLGRSIVSPIELESLGRTHSVRTFPGMLEATRFLYDVLEERTLLEQVKGPQLRRLRDQARRLDARRNRLIDRRRRFEDANRLQETARMLVSSGIALDQRRECVEATDYTVAEPTTRTVQLDPARTVRENIDRMFKMHRKAGRGLKMVEDELRRLEDERARIVRTETRIRTIPDWNAWQSLQGGPKPSAGHGNRENGNGRRPSRGETRSRTSGRRKLFIDGHEVLIGRNGRENDELTFNVADSDDFWLHVADYSGSHVIVRNPSRAPELEGSLLERAAQLAAYYSQARNSNKVSVHYTRRKFVRKPRRAKPGLVLLKEFKTITVEPRNWTEAQR